MKIVNVDEIGFDVLNPEDGVDSVRVLYFGAPDDDSSGTLEYEILGEELRATSYVSVFAFVECSAPESIYKYLKEKAEAEAELWKEDGYGE